MERSEKKRNLVNAIHKLAAESLFGWLVRQCQLVSGSSRIVAFNGLA